MIVERLNRSNDDPFDIEALLLHARLDEHDGPQLISQLARAAALEAEAQGQLAILSQTIRITLDEWPAGDSLRLPIFPVLDASQVTVTGNGEPFEGFGVHIGYRPRMVLLHGRPSGPVVIEYQAGFGADARSIPDDLSQAIMDQAAASFHVVGLGDRRDAVSPHFARIVGRYRGVRL